MHFKIDRTAFLNELNHLQGVAGAKQVIPILSHLLIETRTDRITMRATDLDLTITTGCEASVREDVAAQDFPEPKDSPGEFTEVPAGIFSRFIPRVIHAVGNDESRGVSHLSNGKSA